MKLIPFNLQRALAGDAVVTRDGRKVLQIAYFKDLEDEAFKVVCQIDGEKTICCRYESGKFCDYDDCHDNDLFMAPKTKTYWANVYSSGSRADLGATCESEEQARKIAGVNSGYIKTISFEVES